MASIDSLATSEGTVKEGGVKGMEGKLNGNYLRLISGLCLEVRMN